MKPELKKARKMLREISSLSEHVSLTRDPGRGSAGAEDAIRAYNDLLTYIQTQGVETMGMFSPLPNDASFDRVGVASRLLRALLDAELEEEESIEKSVKVVVGRHGTHTSHINTEELGKLKDIGAVIREHLPEWMREAPPAPPAPPTPPAAPTPPAPPSDRDDA
jgi:hypothetical protein